MSRGGSAGFPAGPPGALARLVSHPLRSQALGSALRSSSLKVLVALGAIVVVALPWITVVHTLRGAEPTVAPGVDERPTAIVWGDRVFASVGAFEAWLRSRGVSYDAWIANHPGAQGILHGKPAARARRRPVGPKARPRPLPLPQTPFLDAAGVRYDAPVAAKSGGRGRKVAATVSAPVSAATAGKPATLSIVEVALLMFAAALVVFGLVPRHVIVARVPRYADSIGELKLFAFALAIAIGAGALAAGAI